MQQKFNHDHEIAVVTVANKMNANQINLVHVLNRYQLKHTVKC